MGLSLKTQTQRYIRQFTGPIPSGSVLLVDVGHDLYCIERFVPMLSRTEMTVILERPDDTCDHFHIPLHEGSIPEESLPSPARKNIANDEAAYH